MEKLAIPRVAVVAATVIGLLVGCGSAETEESMPRLVFDETIDQAISAVAESGEPAEVQGLTEVAWDEAALFSEGATRAEIEDVVGESGLKGDRYMSSTNLLVLRQAGEVVALIGTSPDVFTGEYGVLFGEDAVFAPDGEWDGYVALKGGA